MIDSHSIITINQAALAHNLRVIRQIAPQSKVLAMVKANAYGHGLIAAAKALSEAEGLGVACLEEAIALRQAGIKQRIVVMRGVFNQAELALVDQLKLDVVIHTPLQLKLLSQQTHWLKINTGMHRLGFMPEEIPAIYDQLKHHTVILMTHFSDAENPSNRQTLAQIQCFEETAQNLAGEKSLANSAGILNFQQSHANWVRPGLLLYGVSPIENTIGKTFHLQPVMTWQSQLITIRGQKKGDAIGYNGNYQCEENMPIGIVGIGYGDGYPRHARNGTPLLVEGIEVPLIGRVSMDMLAVDLRNTPSAKLNAPVTLWGERLPIEKVAVHTATNVYELLCQVKTRGKI